MKQLFPPLTDDLEPIPAVGAERRQPPAGRSWLMTNMIASADGATAVNGLSGPLGGPADQAMFGALRGACDAIVVGGETVRAEKYRAPGAGPRQVQADRAERGQAPRPTLVVVTGSLRLDPDLPLFADPENRPIIATTTDAPAERRNRLEPVADVIEVGTGQVDLARLLRVLHSRALTIVLSEGGPALNAQLVADDLVDEWNLTIAPLLGAGQAKRPAQGAELSGPPGAMSLSRVWLADELLFCRWLRA